MEERTTYSENLECSGLWTIRVYFCSLHNPRHDPNMSHTQGGRTGLHPKKGGKCIECRSHTSRRVLHYYTGMAGTMGLCREWSMDLPTHPEHPSMICEKTQGDGFPPDNSCRDMVTLGRISVDFGLRRRLDARNVSCPKLQNMWC